MTVSDILLTVLIASVIDLIYLQRKENFPVKSLEHKLYSLKDIPFKEVRYLYENKLETAAQRIEKEKWLDAQEKECKSNGLIPLQSCTTPRA